MCFALKAIGNILEALSTGFLSIVGCYYLIGRQAGELVHSQKEVKQGNLFNGVPTVFSVLCIKRQYFEVLLDAVNK